MIPKPTRFTKIVRKMIASGRVTSVETFYTIRRIMKFQRQDSTATMSGRARNRAFLAFGTVAVLAAGGPTVRAQPASMRRADTLKPEILGTHGIVAAGRHYSVAAGVRILQQGGNAVDAGVAATFAAAVCEISHFGFGGESPAIIYD